MRIILLWLLILSFPSLVAQEADSLKAYRRNSAIGKGMNLGNALEAPGEGDWGMVIRESCIRAIADAGFNSVRLPVCWPAHTDFSSPYNIDPVFLARVDEILDWCFQNDLAAIITIHHFNQLYRDPLDIINRRVFFSIWDRLSRHYSGKFPEQLIFEPLNEPHENLTAEQWNDLIPDILGVIRDNDPDRTLIIDAPDYAYHGSITRLEIPEAEKNVIVSVRYYLPYEFTHQGAHWAYNLGTGSWLEGFPDVFFDP